MIPDPVDAHVGNRVRIRRNQQGLRQQDLADRLEMSFQQVQKYERGTNRISASMLFHIAHVLRVEPAWFFVGLEADSTGQLPPETVALNQALARMTTLRGDGARLILKLSQLNHAEMGVVEGVVDLIVREEPVA